jgi:hypothetical protein
VEFADVAQMIQLEQPERFNQVVLEFSPRWRPIQRPERMRARPRWACSRWKRSWPAMRVNVSP